ncbi:MAG: diacylglycerol kinase family lipid kinase [Armatimonadota bacterium]|nr:diacylglycerol kinase family lipid kinase [Armatimonadota bacterium]MDR5697046.1 diacylglycerol kinase family lipid kinase [Armatimonadota bacterium]
MPETRATAIINPVAGRGRTLRWWPAVRERLHQAGWAVAEHVSERPGHATDLAAAARNRCDVVVAVGGDGTANEVVNGLLEDGAAPVPVGVVPMGTANDFATCLGIPAKVEEATRTLLAGQRRRIDLGRVGDRYFINVAGVGFDATVAEWVNSRWKLFGGTVMYVVGIFRTLAVFNPVWMRLELDGAPLEGRVFMAAVGNNAAYGGGLRICPHARPDDGWLDVVTIGDIHKTEVFALLPRIYSGGHLTHPKVATARARSVTVTTDPPQPVHADGEPIGRTPATFSLQAAAIEVLTPAVSRA